MTRPLFAASLAVGAILAISCGKAEVAGLNPPTPSNKDPRDAGIPNNPPMDASTEDRR